MLEQCAGDQRSPIGEWVKCGRYLDSPFCRADLSVDEKAGEVEIHRSP
jgi:hypothetical protein